MTDPRAPLLALRAAIGQAPALPERAEWLARIDDALAALPATRVGATPDAPATNGAELDRLRQDVEDAEHARDAANLQRMKVAGQLNTLHKSLAAAAPEVSSGKDAQSDALRRIEWLAQHGGGGDDSAEAVKLNWPIGQRYLQNVAPVNIRSMASAAPK